MKTFSAMSQGDLIIIRDSLKETIKGQKEISLFTQETNLLFSQQPLKYIEKSTAHLQTVASKFSRIRELLVAIDEALQEDNAE